MRHMSIIGMASLVGLLASCASPPKPAAKSPIVPRAPMATKVTPRVAKLAPPTESRVVIAENIRQACGISDDDAYFAFDSARIRQQDHGVLAQLATCFDTGPMKGRVMRLIGHADPRGSSEYNMVLGSTRAESVRLYLANEGLSEEQMQTTSRGAMDAVGTDEVSWAHDRRVDVALAPPSASSSSSS